MLKILFSPAEGKNSGGDKTQHKLFGATEAREEILQAYNEIINSGDEKQIKTLFGLKEFSQCKPYICDIFHTQYMYAIERYNGVAYEHLEITSLPQEAKNYLYENTLIFSNLYGPVLGGDSIANYKVKQGNSIGAIQPEKFYKERFSYQLDLYLSQHDILDLRAGYYEKFYKTKQPYTTLKFLKNGKTISHWAKAYRGIVLREIALAGVDSLEAFHKLQIDTLHLKEILQVKNKTEIIYEIKD